MKFIVQIDLLISLIKLPKHRFISFHNMIIIQPSLDMHAACNIDTHSIYIRYHQDTDYYPFLAVSIIRKLTYRYCS